MGRFQETLIREFTGLAAKRVAERARTKLRKITDTLSGDDSGLKNVWEEICVQVQGEESCYWQTYQEVMYDIVRAELESVSKLEKVALWLQTVDGSGWLCDIEEEEQNDSGSAKRTDVPAAPYDLDAIVEIILDEHLLPMADVYSNRNIERYINRHSSYEMDY